MTARLSENKTKFLLLSTLVAGLCAVASGAGVARGAGQNGWDLDIERAMDAIGAVPGMVVGEAGAGDGYFTLSLARRVGPSGRVYANDISERALRTLERRAADDHLSNIHAVVGETADARFPRHDLQLVVIVHAFHDFSSPVEWLVNLKGYLRPGATVAIIDKDPAQGAESHFWTRERITGYAAEAGYELTKATTQPSAHQILLFRPKTP